MSCEILPLYEKSLLKPLLQKKKCHQTLERLSIKKNKWIDNLNDQTLVVWTNSDLIVGYNTKPLFYMDLAPWHFEADVKKLFSIYKVYVLIHVSTRFDQ